MTRHTKLLEQHSKSIDLKKKERALFSARKEVEIYGNGTTGYKVKHGPHRGKVLGHLTTKSTNNW
jgi:hypothetical protein|tara:strand:+ start:35 stop:229 length:195 start_codon:yes stop_codon:yes gene_type:complete